MLDSVRFWKVADHVTYVVSLILIFVLYLQPSIGTAIGLVASFNAHSLATYVRARLM